MGDPTSLPIPWLQPGTPFFLSLGGLLILLLAARRALLHALGDQAYARLGSGLERGVLTLLLISLIVFSFLQIILRNFFRTGLIWIDPLLRNFVLWIAFLGSFAATAAGRHIAIDVFSRVLPERGRFLLGRLLALFAALVCASLANGAYEYLMLEREFGGDAFLGLRTWHVQSILLLGFVLLVYRFAVAAVFGPAGGESGEASTSLADPDDGWGPEPAGGDPAARPAGEAPAGRGEGSP